MSKYPDRYSPHRKRGPARDGDFVYDIFGARIANKAAKDRKDSRTRPAYRRSYRPEYQAIPLPERPQLVCGICGQKISSFTEVLEALEIRRGEFPPTAAAQSAKSAAGEELQNFTDSTESSTAEFLPAHFGCVLEALGKSCQLQAGERIAYLGSGRFAAVQGRLVQRMIVRGEWSQNPSLSPNNWSKWRQCLHSRTLLATLSIQTDV